MKLIGMARLGRDAEIRDLPSGDKVAQLSLAVTVYDKNAEGNRGTTWVEASMWNKQAEALAPFMKKGTLHCFYLSDVKCETYEGRNGFGAKIVARVDNVDLGPRVSGDPTGGTGSSRPASAPPPASRTPAPPPASGGFSDMDDDIPF